MDCSLPGSSVHGDSAGKNTGVSCHALLQRIFPNQASNPRLLFLLLWQEGFLPLVPPGYVWEEVSLGSCYVTILNPQSVAFIVTWLVAEIWIVIS